MKGSMMRAEPLGIAQCLSKRKLRIVASRYCYGNIFTYVEGFSAPEPADELLKCLYFPMDGKMRLKLSGSDASNNLVLADAYFGIDQGSCSSSIYTSSSYLCLTGISTRSYQVLCTKGWSFLPAWYTNSKGDDVCR